MKLVGIKSLSPQFTSKEGGMEGSLRLPHPYSAFSALCGNRFMDVTNHIQRLSVFMLVCIQVDQIDMIQLTGQKTDSR